MSFTSPITIGYLAPGAGAHVREERVEGAPMWITVHLPTGKIHISEDRETIHITTPDGRVYVLPISSNSIRLRSVSPTEDEYSR